MEKMLKIDMHVHTNGISFCARANAQTVIDNKISAGYDGMVLTNHCQPWYFPASDQETFMKKVINEYNEAKSYGAERDFRVFLGLEVTLNNPFYSDWLLYGATEEFLLQSPCLYKLSQEELYALCEKHGVVLVQAHPYRSNTGYCEDMRPGAPQYLHGVEINCSTGDLEKADKVLDFAKRERKLVTCGTDYHGLNKFCGGTFLPQSVQSGKELASYLKSAKNIRLFLGEEELEVSTWNI